MNNDDDLDLIPDDEVSLGAVTPADVSQQLVVTLMLSGNELSAGLRACADESYSRRDRAALQRIANDVDRGLPLAEALTSDRTFPPYLRDMLSAGVESGQLPRVLGEYLVISRSQQDSRQRLWLTCLYPLTVFLIMLGVMSIFPYYITPQFKDVFNSFGVELPGMTMFFITVSDWFGSYWYIFLAIIVLFVLIIPREFGQSLFRLIPLLGTSAKLLDLSEICVMLGLLIRARLPAPMAFDTLSNSVRNVRFRKGCKVLADQLRNGWSLREVIQEHRVIPAEVLQLLTHSGHPESLADQLQLLGKTYAVQAEIKQRQGLVLLEPLFIFLFAVLGGSFIIAMFMPLVRLLNDLS